MNDKFDLAELNLEELEVVDLGDAAEETRQLSPYPVYHDSAYNIGEYPGR
jgi:hypothetical protein